MLIKTTAEFCSKHWDELLSPIAHSFPPEIRPSMADMTNLLSHVLYGNVIVWCIVDDKEPTNLLAVGTTTTHIDPVTSSKSLLIYSLYSYDNNIKPAIWNKTLTSLRKYALAMDYRGIIAYTHIDKLKNLFERYGGTSRNYLFMEV